MIVIAIGIVISNAIVNSDINDFESFSAIGLEVCFGVPWLSFLIKVFYFDLSAHHNSGSSSHAMRTSVPRAMLWTLLHCPLIGAILWVSEATEALIITHRSDGDSQAQPHAQQCGRRTALWAHAGPHRADSPAGRRG